MSESIEDLAVQRAAYAGLRWNDVSEAGREYYRRLVRLDIVRRKVYEAEQSRDPPRFLFGKW